MKIFVAGATGAIGCPLLAQLLVNGHDVVALTRSPEKAQTLTQQGVEPAIADVFDLDAVRNAISRAQPDVVIEQLTALPKTYTPQTMQAAAALNNRIRLDGGANVLKAAQAAGVRRYLRQSIAFWATPSAGLADEDTPLVQNVSSAMTEGVSVMAEIERRLLETPDLEGIVLRYGFFYGTGTWYATDGDVAQQVRQQKFPIIGEGKGVWSWIHVEDAAIATVAAVEQGYPGIYLIVDDRPLKVCEWLPAYARWLNAPPPPQISVEQALQVSDADTLYYATQLRGVSNAKAKRELNFQPRSLEWLIRAAISGAKIAISGDRS